MGYTTDFSGAIDLSRQLTEQEKEYINTFSNTRRMKRDVNKLMKMFKGEHGNPFPADPTPECIYGVDGEYFVKDDGNCGQSRDNSVVDYNYPPGQFTDDSVDWEIRRQKNQRRIENGECQPGLWCHWIINDENQLLWDGGEKFYHYVEWLKYLIKHFFSKWNVILNGDIEWRGEDFNDIGMIRVKDNVVKELEPQYIDKD